MEEICGFSVGVCYPRSEKGQTFENCVTDVHTNMVCGVVRGLSCSPQQKRNVLEAVAEFTKSGNIIQM